MKLYMIYDMIYIWWRINGDCAKSLKKIIKYVFCLNM